MQPTNRPSHRFRLGSVTLSLWLNRTADGRCYRTAKVERTYRKPNGDWTATASLRVEDLVLLTDLIRQALAIEPPLQPNVPDDDVAELDQSATA